MARVSYFQKYTQRENHVTNNTLLMLRHFYRSSPDKMSALLNAIFEEEMPIGLNFQQQVGDIHSTPDALITQEPLNIYVEAKLHGGLWDDQIRRHLDSIAAHQHPQGAAILVGLTCDPPSSDEIEAVKKDATSKGGIQFFSVTYGNLVRELKKICAEYEQELAEIVGDYQEFLESEKLIANSAGSLVAVPCGTSWKENIEYNIYYEPPSRRRKFNCPFMGIYHSKLISHVGKIRAAAVCRIEDRQLTVEAGKAEYGELSADDQNRIKEMIDNTEYYDLANGEPHRYYVIDRFYETRLQKTSYGGMRGHRYFDLADLIPGFAATPETTAAEVAEQLRGKEFE